MWAAQQFLFSSALQRVDDFFFACRTELLKKGRDIYYLPNTFSFNVATAVSIDLPPFRYKRPVKMTGEKIFYILQRRFLIPGLNIRRWLLLTFLKCHVIYVFFQDINDIWRTRQTNKLKVHIILYKSTTLGPQCGCLSEEKPSLYLEHTNS